MELVPTTGRKAVASAGTAVALTSTSTLVNAVTLYANGADIALGDSNVVFSAATRRGIIIGQGTSYTIDPSAVLKEWIGGCAGGGMKIDLSKLYIDANTNGDDITWLALTIQ